MTGQPVAFELRWMRGGAGPIWYFDIVDDRGQRTRGTSQHGCARQAACAATRHGRRPLRFDGATRLHRGEWVPADPADLEACSVDPASWVWQHHGHTHRPGAAALAGRTAVPDCTAP